MEELDLLTDIEWDVTKSPGTAKLLRSRREIPLTKADRRKEVLPINPFDIIYPIFTDRNIRIPYDPEGIPVTLDDLLTTIYNFYLQTAKEKKASPQKLVPKSSFIGLRKLGPNTYELLLM